MCEHCEQAVIDYGAGSQLSRVIRNWLHPPTEEQTTAYNRAIADLVDCLNAWDGQE
jgi:hypothetical protein